MNVSLRKYTNFGQLLLTNTIIMLLLSVTSAGKNILYTLYDDAGYALLAPLQYVCNYFFGPLSLLFVDWLIGKVQFRSLFYISSFNLNLFLIGGLLVAGCTTDSDLVCNRILISTITICTSILAGILQTIFYVTFITYINYLSNKMNKEMFFGISFSFTSMSNILANVIGYYLAQSVNWFHFFLIIFAISLALQLGFCQAIDSRERQDPQRGFSAEVIYQLRHIYYQISDRKYFRFSGVLLFAGLMNSVIYLFIPVLVEHNVPEGEQEELYKMVFFAFLVTGTGQVIGGIGSGKMSERVSENKVLYMMLIVNLAGIALVQMGNYWTNQMIYFGCFILGLTDSAISSLALIVITKQISTSNHAFIGFNLCQSVGFGTAAIWWGYFNGKSLQYDIGFLYATSFLTWMSFYFYSKKGANLVHQELLLN